MQISIRYPIRPRRRSIAAAAAADLFGLDDRDEELVVADNVRVDIQPSDLVLFVGPSGSGKSSLLREAAKHLGAIDVASLDLPEVPLVDALEGPIADRLGMLSSCGLAEARLALRTPSELSDGQRARFRIALARACSTQPLAIDEFAAILDRPLAKVLAYNLRRMVTRTKIGALIATTHDDLLDELNPDVVVRCHGEGHIEVTRCEVKKKTPDFHRDLWLSAGTRADWPYFARWHYRGHGLGFTKRVILLWHGREPIGICVFAAPAAGLALRSRYFGLSGPRSSDKLAALTRQLWVLSRVVLHPTYRGAGIAAPFVRRACQLCPVPWIEALAAMGHANPFFERAGFVRVGVIHKDVRKSTGRFFGEPVYYVLDNRRSGSLPQINVTVQPML